MLALPALSAPVLVSEEAPEVTYSLISSLFHLRAAGNLSDFPRAKIHTCPVIALPWLRLNLVLKHWWKDKGGWTEVPFGNVGGAAGDPQSLSYLRLLRFARSDSRSVFGGGKLTFVRGWGLAKESDWYRGGHFTQHSFQEVSHQRCQKKAASLS